MQSKYFTRHEMFLGYVTTFIDLFSAGTEPDDISLHW